MSHHLNGVFLIPKTASYDPQTANVNVAGFLVRTKSHFVHEYEQGRYGHTIYQVEGDKFAYLIDMEDKPRGRNFWASNLVERSSVDRDLRRIGTVEMSRVGFNNVLEAKFLCNLTRKLSPLVHKQSTIAFYDGQRLLNFEEAAIAVIVSHMIAPSSSDVRKVRNSRKAIA